jgi:hypothetical protein
MHRPQFRRQTKCRRFFSLGDSLSHAVLSRAPEDCREAIILASQLVFAHGRKVYGP